MPTRLIGADDANSKESICLHWINCQEVGLTLMVI